MDSHMPKIAEMLNVALGESFKVSKYDDDNFLFRLTESEIQRYHPTSSIWYADSLSYLCLASLLGGTSHIIYQSYRPKDGDPYYYVNYNGDVIGPAEFTRSCIDFTYRRIGNCYRTRQEASRHIDKWKAFYESDEVLELN